jgi:hypothetical protein
MAGDGRGGLGGGRRCHIEEENGKKENLFSIFGFMDPIYEYRSVP